MTENTKKKVLLVEDDQIFANVYRNKLLLEGFQVEVAGDGEVGLDLTRSFRPDAILLDLILPKLAGVDLIKQVRLQAEFAQLPIVVFTNTYLTSMVQEAWKAGATKCLTKANCSPNQVISTIRGLLDGTGNKGAASAKASVSTSASPKKKAAATEAAPETAAKDGDAEFQAELQKSFIESLPATLNTLRSLMQQVIKAENEASRIKVLQDLYRRIHAITGNAGVAGMSYIAQMADAFEALLKELYEKPKNINASTLRTVASAIDFMGILFEKGTAFTGDPPPTNVLVVDDEAISRRAIVYALEKAHLKSVNTEDPLTAFQLLAERQFDLIFLDVDMPEMNGFELCSKLRSLPAYKKTPVVFVTSLNDFESRANSTMSGGNDFIGKPFLFIELAVKALLYVLRGKLAAAAPKA